MTASQELTFLLQKLLTLEATIMEMLTIDRPTSILKEKLYQAEELIFEIPESAAYVPSEWRSKLANWFREYSAQLAWVEPPGGLPLPPTFLTLTDTMPSHTSPFILPPPPSQAVAASGPLTTTITVRSPAVKSPTSLQPTDSSNLPADDLYGIPAVGDHVPLEEVEEMFDGEYADPNANQQQELQCEQQYEQRATDRKRKAANLWSVIVETRDKLVSQVEEAIEALPIYTSLDAVDDLKKVTKLVVKTEEKLSAYWLDDALQTHILDRLEGRLPVDKWKQFLAFVGPTGPRTIRQLKRFLLRQLRIFYDNLESVAKVEKATELEADGDQCGCSNYCKQAAECAKFRFTFCYVCLEDG